MKARVLALLALLSACSPVTVLNALAPGTGIETDVPYAPGERHALDIYRPGEQEGLPVVVFVYGGGWKSGDKAQYRFVAAALAQRGYVTVVPDYRVFPAARFPAFVEDAAAAVAWTRANIGAHGGDPGRIFLMGHSAGAHIALLLTLDKRYLAAQGLDPDTAITGTIGLAGPYDFLPLRDPELDGIFAPAGDLRQTQPVTFARAGAPPLLLATGEHDTTVLPRNTANLAQAVRDAGGQAETRLYPRIGHTLVLGAFATPLRWAAPVLADVTRWMADVPQRPARFRRGAYRGPRAVREGGS